MTVLVTGGAGYIGSHMVLSLVEQGEQTTVIDNLSTGRRWLVPEEATFIEGDAGDEGLLDRVMGKQRFDAVIHFAGSIVVPQSVSDPLRYYLNNTVKSRNLIAAAVGHGVPRFIFSSTAAVYGIPEADSVDEETRLAPISPYGRSKLMTEWMLEDVSRAHGLKYVALRYFNVAGADPKGRSGQAGPEATHLIKVAAQVVVGQRASMSIFGADYPTPDGTCIRDYIHVTDLVAAHVEALRYLRQGGDSAVFNCGYGRGSSVLEIIAAVERASGTRLEYAYAPRRAGDPSVLVAKAQRIRNILGWKPCHQDLDEIVGSALRWEKSLMRRNVTPHEGSPRPTFLP
jgi:UDP-glucose 4-epimerase